MSMFARTGGGDLALPLSVVQDPGTLTSQKITDEFNLWKGSWIFDTRQGMPWLQEILGVKSPSLTQVRAIFRRALLATPRVVSIDALEISFDPKTRSLTYGFSVRIDTGAVVPGGATLVFAP